MRRDGKLIERMRQRLREPALLVPGALILVSLVAFGVVTRQSANAAPDSCTAPSAIPGGAAKNINTTEGCDVPAGQAPNPASGFITIAMPADTSTAVLVDALES